jgi:hypothetical protein
MARVVKIKKKIKLPEGNKDIFSIFNDNVSSNDSLDCFKVIYPKYIRYEKECSRYIKLLSSFANSEMMNKFQLYKANLRDTVIDLQAIYNNTFSFQNTESFIAKYAPTQQNKLFDQILNFNAVPAETITEFVDIYNKIADSEFINHTILTCKNLIVYKKYIQDKEHLKDHFLVNSAGVDFNPIDGLNVNFKDIYINDTVGDGDKKLVLLVLHKLYEISHNIYEIVSSPDIDINNFMEMVTNSIGTLKTQIPRCGTAFKEIENSIGMLKNNFSTYYKDFKETGNPSIMMENFVVDVTKKANPSPKVAQQFTKIIAYYRKANKSKVSDPKLQMLFSQFDKNIAALREHTENEDLDEEEDDSDDNDCPDLKQTVSDTLSSLLGDMPESPETNEPVPVLPTAEDFNTKEPTQSTPSAGGEKQ